MDGETALIKAAKEGHLEVVKVLLDYLGTDINAKTESGLTALKIARDNGHKKIVKLLRSRCAKK